MRTHFEHQHIEAIERATCAAVPPQRLAQWPANVNANAAAQWLVPMDEGTVGRAHSAVPTSHSAADLACIAGIEALYEAAGLAPAWRIAQVAAFDPLRQALSARGYTASQSTCVQLADVSASLQGANATAMQLVLSPAPTPAWQQVYLGPGFDAADGASRVAILARGHHTTYAVAYAMNDAAQTNPIAAGALSIFLQPGLPQLASFHGMRTAASRRKQGIASAIVREFAQTVHSQGIKQWFLQVEQGNSQAQSVYAKLGFSTAWVYEYWRK